MDALPTTHPFSHGLPRPPTPARPGSAASVASFGGLLAVPERKPRQRRLSLSNYFLDIDFEYARGDVPRPKLVVTVVRPSPTQDGFPVEVLLGREEWARREREAALEREAAEREAERGREELRAREAEREAEETRRRELKELRRKRRPPLSWKERRRRARAALQRLEPWDEEDEAPAGPRSAPAERAPPHADLRRTRSLGYHPFASPARGSDEHLDFALLLSPEEEGEGDLCEQLPALNFGPRLGASLSSSAWDEPPDEELGAELDLGALVAHSREWGRHPFAC